MSIKPAVCSTRPPSSRSYGPEAIAVSLNLRPTLRSEDRLSVTLDGTALEPLEDSPLHFRISDPDRGTHTLSVTVRDAVRQSALQFSRRDVLRAASVAPLAAVTDSPAH